MHSSFKQFLVEEEKTIYFTFGRMNPPTIGHGKLLEALAKKAAKNPYRIFLSQSTDPKKNPLSYQDKIKAVRKMFPRHARYVMLNKKIRNAMDAASSLYEEGYKNLVMVVGSDRIEEFSALLKRYNGKDGRHGFYNFKTINVVSAGERDPDADGVEGMSASKMRDFAKTNDFTGFSQGLPKSMSNPDAKKMFNDVRRGLGLKEEKEFKNHIQLEPVSELREAYLRDNIFEVGEDVVITRTGVVGKIKHLGTNYLVVESKGETWRCWLDGVSKLDPNFTPSWEIEDLKIGVMTESLDWPIDTPIDWVCGKCNNEPCTCESEIAEQNMKESTDRWYKDQPEWGTPESTKKAKKQTPGESYNVAEFSVEKQGLMTVTLEDLNNMKKFKDMFDEAQTNTRVDIAKKRIDREKARNDRRHDMMIDRARLRDTIKKNQETKG